MNLKKLQTAAVKALAEALLENLEWQEKDQCYVLARPVSVNRNVAELAAQKLNVGITTLPKRNNVNRDRILAKEAELLKDRF